MPFFNFVWVTSWVSYVLASTQSFWKVPDYISHTLPARVLSAVSSPWESYTPLMLQVAGIQPSLNPLPKTAAAASPLAFLPGGFHFGEQAAIAPSLSFKVPLSSGKLQNTAAVGLCRPALPEQKTTDLPKRTLLKEEQIWASGTPETQGNFLFKFVQTLFKWSNPIPSSQAQTLRSVQLVRLQYAPEAPAATTPSTASSSKSNLATESFEIRVQGKRIAEIPDRVKAELLAKRLAGILDHADLDPAQLQLANSGGSPAGKLGNHLLFVVDQDLANSLNRHRDLLAIDWLNNLRVVLGIAPLNLAEAQAQIYGLATTNVKFDGYASWYGPYFHGRPTATGERYNQDDLTAAHPSLPFETYLKVTNQQNGNSVIVRINDRGPYIAPRTLDLSREAARCLDSEQTGVVRYEAVIMQPIQEQNALNESKVRQL